MLTAAEAALEPKRGEGTRGSQQKRDMIKWVAEGYVEEHWRSRWLRCLSVRLPKEASILPPTLPSEVEEVLKSEERQLLSGLQGDMAQGEGDQVGKKRRGVKWGRGPV